MDNRACTKVSLSVYTGDGDEQHLSQVEYDNDGEGPSISKPIGDMILGCHYGMVHHNLAKIVNYVLECTDEPLSEDMEAMLKAARAIAKKWDDM